MVKWMYGGIVHVEIKTMAQTSEEQRLSHNRSQAVYRASAKGKAKGNAWDQSEAGGQSKRLRNQTQRDKRRDTLNQARAEAQQRDRETEAKAKRIRAEAIALYGQAYVDNPSGTTPK